MCPPIIAAVGAAVQYIGGAVISAGTWVAGLGTAGTVGAAVAETVGGVISAIGTGIGLVGGALIGIAEYTGAALGMSEATSAAANSTTEFLVGTFGENAATVAANEAAITAGSTVTTTVGAAAEIEAGAGLAAKGVSQSMTLGKIGKAFALAQSASAVYSMFDGKEPDPREALAFDPITTYNVDMTRREHLDTYLSPDGLRPNWANKLYENSLGDLNTRMGNIEDLETKAYMLSKKPMSSPTSVKDTRGVGLQASKTEVKEATK